MLRKMEGKGRYETAKRLRSTCSQIFRYAIATARAERDVAADLRGALIAPQPVHRAAITSANEAGGLLRAIEAFEGFSQHQGRACASCPHVFVRPGELRYAEWADFDFDEALWTIPKHKTKMRRAHSIPLSRPGARHPRRPSSMTRATAPTCSRRCVRWIGPCRRTPSTRRCGAWASPRTR
jgi:integrase